MSTHLTNAAKDLEAFVKRKIRFYLAVGWVKEENTGVLVVYYDCREALPDKLVPDKWSGYEVRAQGTWPPGVRPPERKPFIWATM